MHGIDVSHHNPIDTWIGKPFDFCMIKATEGKTYTDPKVTDNFTTASTKTDFIGLYHYARPENNGPQDEANNFLTAINTLKVIAPHIKPLLALDIEGKALEVRQENLMKWIKRFNDLIQIETQTRPLLYLSASVSNRLVSLSNSEKLWIAHYSVKNPSIPIWWDCKMWQYTNKYLYEHLDADFFYGGEDDWRKLTGQEKKADFKCPYME